MPNPSFPSRAPVATLSCLAAAVGITVLSFAGWLHFATPLQRFYLSKRSGHVYLKTAVQSHLPNIRKQPRAYPLFVYDSRGQQYLATQAVFDAHPKAVQYQMIPGDPAVIHAQLAALIYGGSLPYAMRWALIIPGVCFPVLLILGAHLDQKRRRVAREGIKLRGWDLVTPEQFNRETKGDGLTIRLAD